MKKIRSIQFVDHPILGNLLLDFTDQNGAVADTVIFAGENGTGKSTILKALFDFVSRNSLRNLAGMPFEAQICLELNGNLHQVHYYLTDVDGSSAPYIEDETGSIGLAFSTRVGKRYPVSGIFSDVDIHFGFQPVSGVTSMQLDEQAWSRKSDSGLASQINQLFVDIQALDDADVALAVKNNPDVIAKDLQTDSRMHRFTDAFDIIFDRLKYDRIETQSGHKEIIFKKGVKDIPLGQLSSGEKQIVYRGGFLLKDLQALEGAFVFIDEPEISLHPLWQMRIMDYYKSIFTSGEGIQTSQIFAATHSPFIIHNDSRRNDKIIVLIANEKGGIAVKDNPDYYKCNTIEAVQDAFSTVIFQSEEPTVYVEGRTDELYLSRALQAFGVIPRYKVQWIGRLDERGQERNTGYRALNSGLEFCLAHPPKVRKAFLFDCDTNHEDQSSNMVLATRVPPRENSHGIKKGIENSLILDNIDLSPFYSTEEKLGDYGETNVIQSLDKMKLCEYICELNDDDLRERFSLLLPTLEKLDGFFAS